jgi:WASH complex subunit strumpellin
VQDGVRKELVRQIATALHEFMQFRTGKLDDFENRLVTLGTKLDGFRQSFEYIQDYINVYGLKIWQEEFSRIINYNVEQESNSFLKKKIYDWQSNYQSDAIPIPQFPVVASQNPAQRASVNFSGRLVRELLSQTDPKRTVYVEACQGTCARL